MIEQMVTAWRFIFEHHPRGDEIMTAISERPEVVTQAQFRKWFHEARSN